MKRIAYARVSSGSQDLATQKKLLAAEGITDIRIEVGSGAKRDRPVFVSLVAEATTADFKLVDAIKKDYLNRRYKAILLDGISTSRFISEARRHEEYGNLARTMLSNNQIPIFTTSMWAPDNPNANPFGAEGNRDLMKWVGVDAAVAFSTLYDRAGRISITA